ncbi:MULTISPECIES: DUF6957 family protein [Pseudomonas]|uniref:DUF6957 family protein n=1 Tax=Pseudomonas TaxID=286 RepID=UPI00353180DE
MFVFAYKIVHGTAAVRPCDWVRSTIARTFDDSYLFETRNTVYVLKGLGQRKSSSLEGISSICQVSPPHS